MELCLKFRNVAFASLILMSSGCNQGLRALSSTAQTQEDPEAPKDPQFSIEDVVSLSHQFTRSPSIAVDIVTDTRIVKWCLSQIQISRPEFTGSCLGGAGSANEKGWLVQSPSQFNLSSGDGSKTVYLWVASSSGLVNKNQTSQNILLDTVVPSVANLRPANFVSPTNSISNVFNFDSSDSGSGILSSTCQFDQNQALPCSSSVTFNSVSEGSHTLTVLSKDKAGNTSLPTSLSWVVDTTAPIVKINSGPSTITNQTTATLDFSATEAGSGVKEFRCKLDTGNFALCTSPVTYSGLNEGSHTFTVISLDNANNLAAEVTYSWQVDLTAPTVTITSKPPSFINVATAAFQFVGSNGVTSFLCRLDGGSFTNCLSPKTYAGLSEGNHIFEVQGYDSAGNPSAIANSSFVVDVTAPVLQLTSTPKSPTTQTNANFQFTVSDSGSGLQRTECRLNGASFQSCSSPVSYVGLALGTPTFEIRSFDSAGNTSSITFTWTIVPQPSGLISFWKFEEGGGMITNSYAGSSSSGALINGPSWTTGKIGTALSFDGIDDQVKIVDPKLNGLTDMTLSTWVFFRGGQNAARIINKGSSASARFALLIGSDNTSFQFNANYTVNGGSWKSPTDSLTVNVWHHLAVSYKHEDPSSSPAIYVDGVLQPLTTLATPSGIAIRDDSDLYFGSRGINNVRVFNGIIDEVRIYNRVLTAVETQTLYNELTVDQVAPTVPTGLLASVLSSNQIDLAWSPSTDNTGVEGYKVFRNGLQIGTTDGTTFSDLGLAPSTTYVYSVSAYDVTGNSSAQSVGETVTTPQTALTEVYPGPGVNTYQSDLYQVEVFDGTTWLSSYTYKFKRESKVVWTSNQFPSVNFTTFGTNGSVDVRITRLGGPITSIQVSPKSKNIPAQITGGQALLKLNPYHKTWITINNDDGNPLFVFADPIRPPVPAGATYFGPGIHVLAPNNNNHYQASNSEIIYLDGGAWVRGNIFLKGTTNVRIMGPGVLSGDLWTSEVINPIHNVDFNAFSDYGMIRGDWNGNNATVTDITIVASPAYNFVAGAKYVKNVKELSPWFWNTDGFNGVPHVDETFSFVGDNAFAPNYQNENTTVTNSFGCTSVSAVFAEGYWGQPSGYPYSVFVDNIDIKTFNTYTESSVIQLWVDNADPTFGYSNQTYQNIRVEGNIGVPLIGIKNKVYPWPGSPAPDPALGNSFNYVLKNISLEGTQWGLSEIKGWDANNGFHNVTIENLSIGGVKVNSPNASNYLSINNFVWGLVFK